MKFSAILAAIVLLFACFAMTDDSYAARMGGGRSFGSKPSMSQPAQRSTMPQAGAAASAAKKPGMGMAGGILGGLLAGTLLGSLLSGNGLGGGFMDLILLAILAFIGWKLYQRFRANRQGAPQAAAGPGAFNQNRPDPNSGILNENPQAVNPFQNQQPYQAPLQRNDGQQGGGILNNLRNMMPGAAPQAAPGVDVPQGFDTAEFLRGAEMAYKRMQSSWDKRDLNDISLFATPAVMRQLQQDAAADPGPSHTEIIKVNTELVGVEAEGDNLRAQVYFDALMRETPDQQYPSNAREIWHFLRIGQNGNWKLAGIQQVN